MGWMPAQGKSDRRRDLAGSFGADVQVPTDLGQVPELDGHDASDATEVPGRLPGAGAAAAWRRMLDMECREAWSASPALSCFHGSELAEEWRECGHLG